MSPNVWPARELVRGGTETGHGYTITRLCQHVVMSVPAPWGGGDAGLKRPQLEAAAFSIPGLPG